MTWMMPVQARHRRAISSLIVLIYPMALSISCSGSNPDSSSANASSPGPGFRLVAKYRPLAWSGGTGQLVYQLVNLWVLADVSNATCKGTGLYVLDSTGSSKPWRTGESLCGVLWQADRVDLSTDRRTLVYADRFNDGRIYKLDLQSLKPSLATDRCLPRDGAPAWSPDGQQIAYSANCEGRGASTLHIMQADGSGARPLAASPDSLTEDNPSWAPDGKRIAFVRKGKGGFSQIAVADVTTGKLRAVATGFAPAWSPSGDWIAYLASDSSENIAPAIRAIRADASEGRELFRARDSTSSGWVGGPLVWSPDSRELVFVRVTQIGYSIWAVDIRDGKVRTLVSPPR